MTTRDREASDMDMDSPLLLNARQAAALCGKSLRTWRSWDAAGVVPRPVRIRRCALWRADELRAWIAAGCPDRQQWEQNSSETGHHSA